MVESGNTEPPRPLTHSEVETMYSASRDPYVVHVIDRVLESEAGNGSIKHDVTDWRGEVGSHIAEKYPLSPRLVGSTVCLAEFRLRRETSPRG